MTELQQVNMAIRFTRMPRMVRREVTTRRLAAAERFLEKQRQAAGLFRDEVSAEQPSPAQRISNIDDNSLEWWQGMRDSAAKTWRTARNALRILSDWPQCLVAWNSSSYPADAVNFLRHVKGWTEKRAELECPLTDAEAAVATGLGHGEWIPSEKLTFSERIAVHGLSVRGMAEKRYVGNLVEWRITQFSERGQPCQQAR